ncbi:unnamed protein product [Rhodiola kirilowii]
MRISHNEFYHKILSSSLKVSLLAPFFVFDFDRV